MTLRRGFSLFSRRVGVTESGGQAIGNTERRVGVLVRTFAVPGRNRNTLAHSRGRFISL